MRNNHKASQNDHDDSKQPQMAVKKLKKESLLFHNLSMSVDYSELQAADIYW